MAESAPAQMPELRPASAARAVAFVAEVGAPIGMSNITVAVPVRVSAFAAGQVHVQDTRAEFEAFLEANGSASIQ